jgi:hypothetical protein
MVTGLPSVWDGRSLGSVGIATPEGE